MFVYLCHTPSERKKRCVNKRKERTRDDVDESWETTKKREIENQIKYQHQDLIRACSSICTLLNINEYIHTYINIFLAKK